MVNATSPPLYPLERPGTIVQEAGWASEPVWTGAEKIASTGIRSPDRPACSESLYQLRYPASTGLTKFVWEPPVTRSKSFCPRITRLHNKIITVVLLPRNPQELQSKCTEYRVAYLFYFSLQLLLGRTLAPISMYIEIYVRGTLYVRTETQARLRLQLKLKLPSNF
jgi:hypothetical protein